MWQQDNALFVSKAKINFFFFDFSGMLETMNDYNKESQQKTVEPDVPEKESKDSNVILPTSEMTLADSVYATFQSGLTAVSNLNLKSGIAALSQEDNESYIPEEDETNQLILESALTSSTRDPMQAHILDQDEVIYQEF